MWWAGQLELERPRKFNKQEKREVVNNIITKLQEEKLQENGWDILQEEFADSISELEKYEPQIICELQAASEYNEMQQKINAFSGTPNKKTRKCKHSKSNSSNSGGGGNKNRDTPNSGAKRKCSICGKRHRNPCKKQGKSDANNGGGGSKQFSKKETAMLKKMAVKYDSNSSSNGLLEKLG